jgi:hypothetical protein
MEYLTINKLAQDGQINNYFHDKLYNRLDLLAKSEHDILIKEAILMSDFGVSSEEDHKIAAYINQHVRSISEKLTGMKLDSENLNIIAKKRFFRKG